LQDYRETVKYWQMSQWLKGEDISKYYYRPITVIKFRIGLVVVDSGRSGRRPVE